MFSLCLRIVFVLALIIALPAAGLARIEQSEVYLVLENGVEKQSIPHQCTYGWRTVTCKLWSETSVEVTLWVPRDRMVCRYEVANHKTIDQAVKWDVYGRGGNCRLQFISSPGNTFKVWPPGK